MALDGPDRRVRLDGPLRDEAQVAVVRRLLLGLNRHAAAVGDDLPAGLDVAREQATGVDVAVDDHVVVRRDGRRRVVHGQRHLGDDRQRGRQVAVLVVREDEHVHRRVLGGRDEQRVVGREGVARRERDPAAARGDRERRGRHVVGVQPDLAGGPGERERPRDGRLAVVLHRHGDVRAGEAPVDDADVALPAARELLQFDHEPAGAGLADRVAPRRVVGEVAQDDDAGVLAGDGGGGGDRRAEVAGGRARLQAVEGGSGVGRAPPAEHHVRVRPRRDDRGRAGDLVSRRGEGAVESRPAAVADAHARARVHDEDGLLDRLRLGDQHVGRRQRPDERDEREQLDEEKQAPKQAVEDGVRGASPRRVREEPEGREGAPDRLRPQQIEDDERDRTEEGDQPEGKQEELVEGHARPVARLRYGCFPIR